MHPRRWPSYFSSCQYTTLNLPPVMCSSPCDPRPLLLLLLLGIYTPRSLSLSLFLGELQCDLNKSFSFQCHLALRLLLALPLVSPSIKPGPVTLFVSMCRVKTNTHTHTSVSSSGFRSPGCFASAASVWGSSLAQIVSVWGLAWLVEFLVVLGCVDYWFADLYAHLYVCTVACICWVDALLVSELQSCVYVCVEIQSMLMPHLDN